MTRSELPRRALLTAAAAVAATAAAGPAAAGGPLPRPSAAGRQEPATIDNRFWSTASDWLQGRASGVRVVAGSRPGVRIAAPAGVTEYTDPHTGTTAAWEYATWTSPLHCGKVPATELIASWNARTPAGTWLQTEVEGVYADGGRTPWYVLGRWASGDQDIRRTSVDGQGDDRSSVWTDTVSVDDAASGTRIVAYRLRLTLYRTPGSGATPTVWRAGAMTSDVPDRFTAPAARPGRARELAVPRYSQNTHVGQYPEYDNGGEAWCSPTSSQMIIEYWGRHPTAEDLAWVNPDYEDPQVCHAARFTYDHQYEGCGNWPFNAAYAATYDDLRAVVTRLGSLTDLHRLVTAGIPVITSQSFLAEELTGAGYGTSGHLMTVVGFTEDGDIIANDPASPSNEAVRRVYDRSQWSDIWLRTKRYGADGRVLSGTGGVCYLYFPADASAAQRAALASVGIR
ncbi:peptidase C39 family protein [Streptomyces rutgersensis]|uniref:Peptidase C39 family protein n=1 Tax=Streptomyces rutgersensis TaxID=53451 RepID=A0ABX6RJ07_9ACTN|nr:peptidase C39 family protein [Streptomyces rutgersensis]QNE80234.1 peptidase C39 family protein [Streptomyces rutgersensis]